jgi:hypothetical protein
MYESQAPQLASDYRASMMLPWLAQAARELREARGRKLVNVASSLGASESTVWRFENAVGWPERPDLMIAAYADDLDIAPLAIWSRALELWRAAEEAPPAPPGALGRDLVADATTLESPQQRRSPPGQGSRAGNGRS